MMTINGTFTTSLVKKLIPFLLFAAFLHAQTPNFSTNEASTYTTSATMLDTPEGNENDSQYTKNLLEYSDPSFLSAGYYGIEQIATGTTTGFTSPYIYGVSRTVNDFAGFNFLVACHENTSAPGTSCTGGPQGCTGTIASNTVPSGGNGPSYTFSTTCAAALSALDTVYITSPPGKTGTIPEIDGTWQFGGSATCNVDTTSANLPPAPPAPILRVPQYIQCSIPQGGTAVISIYTDDDNGAACNTTNLTGNYSMTLTASVQSGTGVSANLHLFRLGGVSPVNGNVNLSGTWATYTVNSGAYTAELPANACGPTPVAGVGHFFTISNSGGTTAVVGVTNVSTNELSDTNPSPFRDDFVNKANSQNVKGIRFAQFGGASLISQLSPTAQRPPYLTSLANAGGAQEGTFISIPEKLAGGAAVGTTVSLVIPPYWTNTELSNLVDFLAGPTSTAYGAFRSSVWGQAVPYTNTMTINLELGNEIWNSGFPGTFINPEQNYWPLASQMCHTLKSNANWNSHLTCNISMQKSNGAQNASFVSGADPSGYIDKIASSNYSLANYSTNCGSYVQDIQNETYINTHLNTIDLYGSLSTSSTYKLFHYESGLAPFSNTSCTQGQVNGGVEGLGSGLTAILAPMLEYSTFPGAMTDYVQFQMNQLNRIISGSPVIKANIWGDWAYLGGPAQPGRGRAVAMGGANKLFAMGTGYALTGTNVPTVNAPAENGLPAYNNIPMLIVGKYGSGTQRGYIALNRQATAQTFTLSGTNAPTGTVTLSEYHSTNGTPTLNDNNETVNTAGPLQLTSLGTVSNPASFTVPAYATLFITYSTASPPPACISITGTIVANGTITFKCI